MPDNYPTFTHKPTLVGTLSLTPNVTISRFLGGFTGISGNGRRTISKEILLVQPLNSDAEFTTFETFLSDHAASSFVIEYLDKDRTGATTMTVIFNGTCAYSTDGGKSEMSIPVLEI